MSGFLAAYVGAHAALALAWLAFAGWLRVLEASPALAKAVSFRTRALFGRALLVAAAVAWPLAGLLPRHHAFPEATIFWKTAEVYTSAPLAPPAPTAARKPKRSTSGFHASSAVAWALLVGSLLEGALAAKGLATVRRVLRSSVSIRRAGRIRLLAHADLPVPFALRLPGRAYIVLPERMLLGRAERTIALRHEGQHHRHGDAAWALALAALSPLFPLNPFVRLWRRTLQDLHEVACDEALVGHRRLDPRAYGRCLVDVAEAALSLRSRLPGTASMAGGIVDRCRLRPRSKPRLKLRLERRLLLFHRHFSANVPCAPRSGWLALCLTLGVTTSLLTVAYAAQGARPHGPLTLEEAKELVAGTPTTPEFPLVMNELVLARLNKIITDPARTQSIKGSLKRMERFRPGIDAQLTERRYPKELVTIPLVESGYENRPQKAMSGAGLWMFIKSTARNFGLRVDDRIDERLDIERETDAAMRLLGADRLRFDDWLLALAAYNQGEGVVQEAIDKGGTRDAWTLVQKGGLNDYLVYVTTGVILMAHPELLE